MVGFSLTVCALVLLCCGVPKQAAASQILSTTSVTNLRLGVDGKGEAMVTYTADGKMVHLLAWGAKNALASPVVPGLHTSVFSLAYDGGYSKYFRDNPVAKTAVVTLRNLQTQMAAATRARNNPVRYALKPRIEAAYSRLSALRATATNYWQTFSCSTAGPPAKGVLVSCSAPDGSTWAIEPRTFSVLAAGATQSSSGIALSHWQGTKVEGASTRGITTSAVTGITLGVNANGEAMVSYRAAGKSFHVLASGQNSVASVGKQVSFDLAYDGGYTKYFRDSQKAHAALTHLRQLQDQMRQATAARNNPARYALKPQIAAAYAELAQLRNQATDYWQTFGCPAYTGPEIPDMVAACRAPDGSYWAVQSWDRDLPDYGVAPTPSQQQMEIHLAHWTGPLPILTVHVDWSYAGRWNHLWGTYTYEGRGVYGFHSTAQGMPLDSFGRNIYLDTLDSAYGPGWHRENSFLTHGPAGSWCYSVNPHLAHPAGTGSQYRITILGPGVTPDASITVQAPSPYDKPSQLLEDTQIDAMHDPSCVPHEGSQPGTDLTSAKK